MLDQFDLFEDTPKTSVVTRQPKAVTPVDNVDKMPKRPIFCPAKSGSTTVLNTTLEVNDKLDIFSFALQEARRIWPKGDQHRRRSLAQLEKFADFADNKTRALRDYKSSHVHRFLDHLEDLGASDSTLNRYAATVSSVFRYANKIRVTDFTLTVAFKDETGNERPRAFTDEEVEQLLLFFLDHDKQYMHDMMLLSLRTGMRMGEILALGNGDIYISNCEDWIELPGPFVKNKTGRSVPIAHPETRAAAKRLAATLADDWNQKTFYRWWKKARATIGKGDPSFTFHVCRHTCLTNMSEKLNKNAFTIAKLAGHKNLKTSSKYIHSRDETMLALAQELA